MGGKEVEDERELGSLSPQVHSSLCNHTGSWNNGPRVAVKDTRAQIMSHRSPPPHTLTPPHLRPPPPSWLKFCVVDMLEEKKLERKSLSDFFSLWVE